MLADYSVGPTELQAAYVMQAIAGGDTSLLEDDSWWRPSTFAKAPVDPAHQSGDPKAWREYTVSKRNTFFLADRDYTFDPRKDKGMARGFPSAGMLTSLGFLDAYPRERLRAARAPRGAGVRAAPAAWQRREVQPLQDRSRSRGPMPRTATRASTPRPSISSATPRPACPSRVSAPSTTCPAPGRVGSGIRCGGRAHGPTCGEPFAQWNKWYRPGSRLTPATEAEADENPYALFLDFLPPDDTLLGQTSDGTIGPLGFAKMIVAAGAFDRCVVRRVHERIMGRDIDPTTESGYLDTLTGEFVSGGRLVRPFVKSLTQSIYFRKGR